MPDRIPVSSVIGSEEIPHLHQQRRAGRRELVAVNHGLTYGIRLTGNAQRGDFIHRVLVIDADVPVTALRMVSRDEDLQLVGSARRHRQPGLEFLAGCRVGPADILHNFLKGILIRAGSKLWFGLPWGYILRAHEDCPGYGLSVWFKGHAFHGQNWIVGTEIDRIVELPRQIKIWIIRSRKLSHRAKRDHRACTGTGQ